MKSYSENISPITKVDIVVGAILGVASLIIYVRTLAPGLLFADIGEFQTLIYRPGVTHPTGYPIYILLGRLFTILPVGNPAWRANLFNATLSSLNISFIYFIVRMLAHWRIAAIASAITMALTPLYWYFSIFAESYIPASAFLTGILFCLLLWQKTRNLPWLAASAILGSLSLGVHISVVFIAPAVLIYVVLSIKTSESRKQDTFAKTIYTASGAVLLGLMLVLLAFFYFDHLNSSTGYFNAVVRPNLTVWGLTNEDINTPIKRLVFLFTARQFQFAMFANPITTMPALIEIFINILTVSFTPLVLAFIGFGLIHLFFVGWREGLLMFVAWGLFMFFMVNYKITQPDLEIFFLSPLLFIWYGVGLSWIHKMFICFFDKNQTSPLTSLLVIFLSILILGGTTLSKEKIVAESWQKSAVSFMSNSKFVYYAAPLEKDDSAYKQAQALVDVLEDGAIVFVGWDVLYPCYYVAQVVENRSALDFHEAILIRGDINESTADYITSHLTNHRIYFYNKYPKGLLMDRFITQKVEKDNIPLLQVIGMQN